MKKKSYRTVNVNKVDEEKLFELIFDNVMTGCVNVLTTHHFHHGERT